MEETGGGEGGGGQVYVRTVNRHRLSQVIASPLTDVMLADTVEGVGGRGEGSTREEELVNWSGSRSVPLVC